MPNDASSRFIPIATAVLSVISAVGVAFISYRAGVLQSEVRREEVGVQESNVALQQSRFDAEERQRKESQLAEIVPKLLSDDPAVQREGRGLLFVLMKDESAEVLSALQLAVSEAEQRQLQPALERATRETAADEWIVVAGADRALEEALHEVTRAERAGYNATLMLRDGWYHTAIGPFPTQSDAQRANISVRSNLRSTAYVINLARWCPSRTSRESYVECVTRR